MALEIVPSRVLLGVYADTRFDAESNYFRNLGGFDSNVVQFTGEEILFEKLAPAGREIAPFILPTNVGRPVYKRKGSAAKSFKPAYVKPRDPVVPQEQFTRRPGNLYDAAPKTPQQNRDAEIAAITQKHKSVIERRLEWMASQAMLYGGYSVDFLDGPSVNVLFDRDATLSITKTTDLWTDSYDILGDIQNFIDRQSRAPFGGITSRMTIGRDVWAVMQKNEGLLKLMDLTVKNSDVDLPRGLIPTVGAPNAEFKRLGTVSGLEIVLYNDFYEDNAGNQVDYMNSRDILLTTGNVGGVMAYGAIMDHDADLQAIPVFPKMWKNEDPSAIHIMHQSAPLAVLVNPNRTLRARVVEEDSNSAGS